MGGGGLKRHLYTGIWCAPLPKAGIASQLHNKQNHELNAVLPTDAATNIAPVPWHRQNESTNTNTQRPRQRYASATPALRLVR